MTTRVTPSPSRPHIDPLGCRDLWRSVLLTAVRDLCSGPAQWRERQAAELWVGAYPRRAFREVCDLAEIDPFRVHRVLRALRALAPEDQNALFSLEARAGPQIWTGRRRDRAEVRASVQGDSYGAF